MSDETTETTEEEVTEETAETEQTKETQETAEETAATDWRSGIPEDLKATADRFSSPEDAIRAIADLRKRDSQVRVPGKDADDKEVAAFNKAIGVPETAEEYAFPEIPEEEMTEAIQAEREGWAKFFHENSVPKSMADALTARFFEEQAAQIEALQAADKQFAEQQTENLKKKWQGDEFDKNTQFANNALVELAKRTGADVEALKQIETKAGRFLLDDAEMVQLFAAVGREMQTGSLGAPMSESERDTIDEQIADLRKRASEAQSNGDGKTANRLYQQEQDLIAKRDGSQAIVGQNARAA